MVWRLWPSGMWYCFVWWPLTHVFDEDGGSSSFLWNIGNSLSNYMALHSRLNIVSVISVLIICHTMPHCYSQPNPCTMGHILYLVPAWALATAWLYFLSCLAPALDVEHEVSELLIVVDWNLERHSLKSGNFVCEFVCIIFLNTALSYTAQNFFGK